MLVEHNLNKPFVFVACSVVSHSTGAKRSRRIDLLNQVVMVTCGLNEGESDFVPSSDPAKMAVSFPFLSIALA